MIYQNIPIQGKIKKSAYQYTDKLHNLKKIIYENKI